MAEEKKNYAPTMSAVLASSGVTSLGQTLGLTPEQTMKAKSAALQLSSNTALYKCDKYSLIKYCFEMARYNFSRDDCCYPVPYGNYVQAQIGYKGFREICLRSGAYREINCNEVLSCDKVIRDRETGQIKVEFEEDYTKSLNATVIGYYAYAVDNNGEISNTLYWSKEKAEQHGKKYSKTFANGPWATSFDKMAKKTVIKQLCENLKTTPELNAAIKIDQKVLTGEGQEDVYADNPLCKDTIPEIVNEETEPDLE